MSWISPAKKRIAIAMVLLMNLPILVLDEASAGLDRRASRTLINLLHELPITILIFTHKMPSCWKDMAWKNRDHLKPVVQGELLFYYK